MAPAVPPEAVSGHAIEREGLFSNNLADCQDTLWLQVTVRSGHGVPCRIARWRSHQRASHLAELPEL